MEQRLGLQQSHGCIRLTRTCYRVASDCKELGDRAKTLRHPGFVPFGNRTEVEARRDGSENQRVVGITIVAGRVGCPSLIAPSCRPSSKLIQSECSKKMGALRLPNHTI